MGARDIRCGGSGAKLGGDSLARVLERIGITAAPEDAAVLRPVVNAMEVQTIDGFRAILDEPYLVGRIAAEHALNDVYAMGGLPRTAMAWVTVPYGEDALMEDDLYQVMAGAKTVFEESGADLVGGHSGQGWDLSVGFAVSGTVDEHDVWHKHRIAIDDALILTKPIGTGIIMSANTQARCRGDWLVGALESMQLSNKAALSIMRDADVRACTDVTGFGLLGHATEMSRPARLCIEVYPARVPGLAGARDLMDGGICSTLQATNERVLDDVATEAFDGSDTLVRVLCDPQTSGGLLAAVRPDKAVECVNQLRTAGYAHANVVGRVVAQRDDGLACMLARG